MSRKIYQSLILKFDRIFFSGLCLACVLYSVYGANFAERHIKLDFLDFPVFIGEIILVLCWAWLVIRWSMLGFPRQRWGWVLIAYIAWILVKAVRGYTDYGPLAFRNAALFYYPLFAVFTYWMMRDYSIKHPMLWAGLLLGIMGIQFHGIFAYFYLPYFLLALVCVCRLPGKKWKWAGLFAIAFVFPFREFLSGGRAILLGHLAAFIFLLISVLIGFVRLDRKKKWLLGGIGAGLLIGIYIFFSSGHALRTTVNVRKWLDAYVEGDRIVQAKRDTFQRREIEPQLYHSNRELIAARKAGAAGPIQVRSEEKKVRTAYGNILFRLFIWRDMMREYWTGNRLTGVSFGRPLRSLSIEILVMAWGEWVRDGWIMPHNVFVNMIYRAGIIGLGLIIAIFTYWGAMVRSFITVRSIEGLLLCAILIYWLVVAAFSVTLELPYQAIPFWSLWGGAWAYRKSLTNLSRANRKENLLDHE